MKKNMGRGGDILRNQRTQYGGGGKVCEDRVDAVVCLDLSKLEEGEGWDEIRDLLGRNRRFWKRGYRE